MVFDVYLGPIWPPSFLGLYYWPEAACARPARMRARSFCLLGIHWTPVVRFLTGPLNYFHLTWIVDSLTITLSRAHRTVYVRLCLSSGIGDEEEPSYLKRDLPADYCCCILKAIVESILKSGLVLACEDSHEESLNERSGRSPTLQFTSPSSPPPLLSPSRS